MSAYSQESLVDRLRHLQNTQQSIQTLSHWVIYHKKRCQQSVQIWEKELGKAPPNKKLTFFYLANDIIQNSRRRGTDFLDQFAPVIRRTLPTVYRQVADSKSRSSMDRMVDVWEQRKVYTSSYLSDLRKALAKAQDAAATSRELKRKNTFDVTALTAIKKTPLSQALSILDESEVETSLLLDSAEAIDESITSGSVLNRVVGDPKLAKSTLEQAREAHETIVDVVSKLDEEVKRRGAVMELLVQAMTSSEEKMESASTKLKAFRDKAKVVKNLQSELESIVNPPLPDEPPRTPPDNDQPPPQQIEQDMELERRDSPPTEPTTASNNARPAPPYPGGGEYGLSAVPPPIAPPQPASGPPPPMFGQQQQLPQDPRKRMRTGGFF